MHKVLTINSWNTSEKKEIDRKIPKLLACNKVHHPKVDEDCFYFPRAQADRGLVQFELSYQTNSTKLGIDLETTSD